MCFYFSIIFLEWLSNPFISTLLSSLILAFLCLCSYLLCFVSNTTPFSSCSFTTSKFSNQTSSLLLIPGSCIFFALSFHLLLFLNFFPPHLLWCIFLPTLFCRLSVAQEGQNIKTKEQNKDNPKNYTINQPAKQKSGIWIVGCLVICCPKKWQRYGSTITFSLSYSLP